MNAYDRVIRALGKRVTGRRGDWVAAKCPAHEDDKPSLGVSRGDGKWVRLKCQAGCEYVAIVEAMGLKMIDLANQPLDRQEPARIVATYPYKDETGKLLYEVVRFDPKGFRQRRPNGQGWDWSLGDVRRVLYHLPQLIETAPRAIYVVEGERDVHTLDKMQFVATTNAGGAGKWRPEYNEVFRGRHAVIIPDNDDAGRNHAALVAASLTGIAAGVRIVHLPNLPPKGDVTDWVKAGGTRAELMALVSAKPAPPPAPDTTARDAEVRRKLAEISKLVDDVNELLGGAW